MRFQNYFGIACRFCRVKG